MNDLFAYKIYKKKKNKKINKKGRKFKEVTQFMGKSSIFANWVQIEMGKT